MPNNRNFPSAARSMSAATVEKNPRKAAWSGWIGSVLEYYDFFIYATATALIFPQQFFPTGNPVVSVAASLGTFGVAYLARPIGAIIMGQWGDKHGRKSVLVISMLMMGTATFLVGCLPTYNQIGLWAPVLLVLLRLIQGIAVAGEQSGAAAMVLEHSPFGRRGYFCSFTIQGNIAGQLLAAAAFLPMPKLLGEAALQSWGWRIPFMFSAVVVLIGYLIRRSVDETPAFQEEQSRHDVPASPLREAFRTHKANMGRVFLMIFVSAVFVTVTVFGTAYATQPTYGLNLDKTTFLWIPVIGNAVAVLIIPFVGRLSDVVGRRPVFVAGALGSGLFMYAFLYFINARLPYMALATAVVMWGVIYQGYNAVFPAFFQELFPTSVRVSAVAFPTQVGYALTAFFPALSSMIATKGSVDAVPLTVGSICMVSCVLAAIGAWTAKETSRIPLEKLGDPNATPMSVAEYERYTLESDFHSTSAKPVASR
ncbi:MFS transporter [Caballeronia sp. J97]|uniref:MFS transporter n=1 Tax=Caballeronia sp. J97 TaxID=2805429 RepID=UPI002AAFE92D|nr:MFS transporter [Caballeronia sp. J97]